SPARNIQSAFRAVFQGSSLRSMMPVHELLEEVLVLDRPAHLQRAVENVAEESVQLPLEDLVELRELQVAQNTAKNAIGLAWSAAGNGALDLGQGPRRGLQTEAHRARKIAVQQKKFDHAIGI